MDIINKIITTIISVIAFSGIVVAAESNTHKVNDSIKLDDIVVTGTMTSVNLKNVPMSITIVDNKQIRNRIEPSLLPILTEEVPGLFITQRGIMGYGVSGGSAGTMSIRGIGGAPTSGVLILIDGHPQYMGLMGHPLADSYQSSMTERVEVVRGPASVLYGSNAMGGVINIITQKQKLNGFNLSSQLMYGSYNTLSFDLSSMYRHNKLFGTISLGYNKSDGHRDNMNFMQKSIYAKVGYDISNNWTAFADINLSDTDSSNPGMISNLLEDNDAEVMRGVTSVAIENRYRKTSGHINFFYNFGSHYINDGYSTGGKPLNYRFSSDDSMMGLSANQSFTPFKGNKTTVGLDYQRFGGEAWRKFEDESKNINLSDIHLYSLAGFANMQQSIIDNKLTLNAGIRIDYHEKNKSEWIPQFGVSYIATANTNIKAIVGKGFRNPTIREMYMFPPQNPNLLAERLMNYEVSISQSILDNNLNLGLSVFYINGDNIIQETMVDGKPMNTNSGKIINKGFEITSAYNASPNLRLNANYSFLDMANKIVASPKHKLYISGGYNINKWHISSGIQYISGLYTSYKPNATKENFVLWNARINYQLHNNVSLFCKAENILNQKYEINSGFPMPGTNFFGGLRLNL